MINLKFIVDGVEYPVRIIYKNNKRLYLRVNSDLEIIVTCNRLYTMNSIKKIIEEKQLAIIKMIESEKIKNDNNIGFHYLGNKYNIIYKNIKNIEFDDNNVYFSEDFDIDKWYKKQASCLFLEHLNNIQSNYSRKTPPVKLRIRKMTTRWGVCNTKSRTITLNLYLIKRNTKYLDYVIVHELAHLIHPNHSYLFWRVVEENMVNYKKYVKEMKEFS